ncbi:hypothetical protein [Desulfosporosinus sp.]|uniref:hypothetical protein n=1 Tax=Desulfosporosinus sp. TaxID=157907 RepID=UPI00231E40F9|nr:hypothetical protein [Desulfosporosinus sp.]MDA8223240.1 hypothetical protein [Desulfitobacterium hafniense]
MIDILLLLSDLFDKPAVPACPYILWACTSGGYTLKQKECPNQLTLPASDMILAGIVTRFPIFEGDLSGS